MANHGGGRRRRVLMPSWMDSTRKLPPSEYDLHLCMFNDPLIRRVSSSCRPKLQIPYRNLP